MEAQTPYTQSIQRWIRISTYGDNAKFGGCTDNKEKETVISDCSEMRTEGTSRSSVGMLSRLLRMERVPCHSCACSARKPGFHMAKVPGRLTGPWKERRRTGVLRVRTTCVSRVFDIVASEAIDSCGLNFGNVAHALDQWPGAQE